ncbi:MAG TPA: AAA family ATPase [Steroidobacteraceae bacterium]|nr:AAA family ATPase [Steroidobacteraceae bacterium]
MLIELQVCNFRSFRENQIFSMVAGAYPEHLGTNTFDPGLPGFNRLLRSGAVYGSNAAGKTNLLRALQFIQSLVLNSASSTPATAPPYTPFKFSKATRRKPSRFQVTFIQHGVRYEYGFAMDAVRIREEWLMEYVNPRGRAIFTRMFDDKKHDYTWKFSTFLKGQRSVWSAATRPNALFLSTAIQLNSKQLLPVFEWFQKRLVVIVGPQTLNQTLTFQLFERPEGKGELLPFLREADLGITDVQIEREAMPTSPGRMLVMDGSSIIEQRPGVPVPNLLKVTLSHGVGKEDVALDLSEESAGTQELFKNAGAWLNVFKNGEVLVIDEIDKSLHPLLTRFLIQRFHSSKLNPHNAQLIFSTHNTYLLDQDLLRRDQIWFVEKDSSGASRLYPLTDFKPRNDEVLERGYLRGRYGALPVLDEIAK